MLRQQEEDRERLRNADPLDVVRDGHDELRVARLERSAELASGGSLTRHANACSHHGRGIRKPRRSIYFKYQVPGVGVVFADIANRIITFDADLNVIDFVVRGGRVDGDEVAFVCDTLA